MIYDSGPLNVLERIFAIFGAMIAFVLSLLMASIPFFAFAQNGLQWGFLFLTAFAFFMSAMLLVMGLQALAPVLRRFSLRVYVDDSKFKVIRAFPWKMMDQVLDLDRINAIEVIHKRKGGSHISVLFRFGEVGPSMKDYESIGPFYRRKQAEAVATAIQAELLPQNFDEKQIAEHERFDQRIVLRIVLGFCIVFELFVCTSLFGNWNQMGLVDRIVLVSMAIFPGFLWYSIRRNIKKERGSRTPNSDDWSEASELTRQTDPNGMSSEIVVSLRGYSKHVSKTFPKK